MKYVNLHFNQIYLFLEIDSFILSIYELLNQFDLVYIKKEMCILTFISFCSKDFHVFYLTFLIQKVFTNEERKYSQNAVILNFYHVMNFSTAISSRTINRQHQQQTEKNKTRRCSCHAQHRDHSHFFNFLSLKRFKSVENYKVVEI